MTDRVKRDSYGSRSRSRSPFRKNFNERSTNNDDFGFRKRDRSPENRRSEGKNRIYVNNIPFECRWMELKDLFREKVGDVVFVDLFNDDSGKFKGCGVIEFKDAETALKAVEVMHKYEIRGRQLNVKIDSEDYERRRPTEREFPRSNDDFIRKDFNSKPQFNTYGLNVVFLKSLGINGPLSCKVFISNLDFKVTEKKLEEVFKIAGKLVKVELNVDSDGKSKGHGTAEYENPLEAVQAISMFNGQRLYARIINVRMDKFVDEGDNSNKLPSGLHGIGKGLGINGQPMQFNKNSTGPTGTYGMGMGAGSFGNDLSSGGLNVGTSGMDMLSSRLGLSSGLNSPLSGERSSNLLGFGLQSSNLGLGGSSSLSGGGMGRSSLDGLGRNSFDMVGGRSSGYRDSYDRHNDNFSSHLSDTVYLGNLPNSFNWTTVKDRFRDVGEIMFAELKGQGNAIIRYSSPQDAQRAVDRFDGIRLDGRSIQVRLY